MSGLRLILSVVVGVFLLGVPAARGADGLPVPLAPLGSLWTREPGAGWATVDASVVLKGAAATHVHHSGQQDWSLAPGGAPVPVRAGELLQFSVEARKLAGGTAEISLETLDGRGQVIEWEAGARVIGNGLDQTVRTRFVVPEGVLAVRPRITGGGRCELWVARLSLVRSESVADLRRANLPASVDVETAAMRVSCDVSSGTFAVLDRRNGRTWRQAVLDRDLIVTDISRPQPTALRLQLLDVAQDIPFTADVQLDAERAEFAVALHADAGAPVVGPIGYPAPFVTGPGSYLVIPMNEGISYPVDDASIAPMSLITYGGHGICMGFFGAAEASSGAAYGAIIETADDADINITRGGMPTLCVAPRWEAQRQRFGYDRKIRYTFFTSGGHVAIAKRYREYVQSIGRFKTLLAKRQTVGAVDQLIGAVNVWYWGSDPVQIVREMQAAGIQRILWSQGARPDELAALNALGVLTSRYDIYQDVMDPGNYPLLRYVHPDWPAAAWPKDLMRDDNGEALKGWAIERKDGAGMIPCGVVCDRQAIGYALDRIGRELETHPYRCRFIDTTTASPFRECYDPAHPMTRTDSRVWKMRLLETVSDHFHLVCGSETGHDAAVPYADYFEGMLSLGPYRVPDAGRAVEKILDVVPENISKFQLGERYRLPLWELVYHDCVVSHWYWGDYNNKLPAVWQKRDLFNALYGTAPMFMFGAPWWQEHQAEFRRSYQATCPLARAVGYSEMIDHRFLTPDRSVQETRFANGVRVLVNFGDQGFDAGEGRRVGPRSVVTIGLE